MEPDKLAERYYMEQDKRLENTLCRNCQFCRTTTIEGIEIGFCLEYQEFLTEEELDQTMKEGGCV